MESTEGAIGSWRWPSNDNDVTCRLVEALSDHAVYWVIERRYGEYDDRSKADNLSARGEMRGELYETLEFLIASLATGEPRLFSDYVQWRLEVLGFRSQQTAELAARLRLLAQFFAEHFGPMSGVSVSRILASGLAVADGAETPPISEPFTPAPLAHVEEMTGNLIRGDIDAARVLARRAEFEGRGYLRIATGLFQPALYAVGQLWQRNEITVAQEHLACSITQTILTQIFVRDEFSESSGRKALFACVAGNTHSLGLRLVCDGFELRGWSVQFLGASVPTEALLLHIADWHPEVVCLSVALVSQLPELRRLVVNIRERFGERRPSIVVGGLATNKMERVWEWIGADEWFPDAERASAGRS
ncbi:MAG: cobalamin-dependent protein [Rhodospirillales bacterium]